MGLLDFNLLSGDWPSALPDASGGLPRQSAFALLREGTSWWHNATGLLLSFESIGGCAGAPGLPLYNHSAPAFYGYRGEWPGQETFQRADYTGFSGLECARLTVATSAPAPSGQLEFGVEAADEADVSAAASGQRRRMLVQPQSSLAALLSGSNACDASSGGPVLRLRLPLDQQLSSVIWTDAANRTVAVQTAEELAAAKALAAGNSTWATPAVALPTLTPLVPWQGAPALPAGLRYSVLLLAPDGSHSRADIAPVASSNKQQSAAGQGQYTVQYKHYAADSLAYSQSSLAASSACVDADGRVVLVSLPSQQDSSSSDSNKSGSSTNGNNGGKGDGLPIAMLGAAAGGGVVLLAAVVGLLLWCRRRRRQAAAGAPELNNVSVDSFMTSKK
jgi:hypothetical protein